MIYKKTGGGSVKFSMMMKVPLDLLRIYEESNKVNINVIKGESR